MWRRFVFWWHKTFPCWTECYPEGWRSRTGISMSCEDCNALHDIEHREFLRRRAEAQRLSTRPDFV